MAIRNIFLLIITFLAANSYAQLPADFKVEKIDKQVKDFTLDSINLSSPLDYYLSRAQVRLSGKYRNWRAISTSMFDYSADVPDEVIDDYYRDYILNETIDRIISLLLVVVKPGLREPLACCIC